MSTLARGLKEPSTRYANYKTSIDDIKEALKKEINGHTKLLGWRAMIKKLRIEYFIYMLSQLVQIAMCEVNPEGIANRQVHKKMKKKQPFTSQGSLWIVSLEGPDKLCGCQNSTFLLGVYGYLDTISRKKLFIFIPFFSTPFSSHSHLVLSQRSLKRNI